MSSSKDGGIDELNIDEGKDEFNDEIDCTYYINKTESDSNKSESESNKSESESNKSESESNKSESESNESESESNKSESESNESESESIYSTDRNIFLYFPSLSSFNSFFLQIVHILLIVIFG